MGLFGFFSIASVSPDEVAEAVALIRRHGYRIFDNYARRGRLVWDIESYVALSEEQVVDAAEWLRRGGTLRPA